MELKRRISIKLKTIRKSRDLTQDDLADLVGRSVDAISNIERCKGLPSLATLEAVASKLEIPIGDFFDSVKGRQSAARLALEAQTGCARCPQLRSRGKTFAGACLNSESRSAIAARR